MNDEVRTCRTCVFVHYTIGSDTRTWLCKKPEFELGTDLVSGGKIWPKCTDLRYGASAEHCGTEGKAWVACPAH